MRQFISLMLLAVAASPAFARDLPEPESLSLLAIGAVAFLVSAWKSKK